MSATRTAPPTAAGIDSAHHPPAGRDTEEALLTLVADLNTDPAVDGILVQLPLPPQIARRR